MRLKSLLRVGFIVLGLGGLIFFSLMQVHQISRAQGGVTLTKTLNQASPVVRVGEVLSFNIVLVNNASFTLTNVTMVDDYDETTLAFAGATPGQDLLDVGSGVITWSNVAAPYLPPGIIPGQTLTFTVFFTAEHPRTAIVNSVRAQDITGTMGAISDTTDMDQVDEAVGGSAPIAKFLSPPGSLPAAGFPVTFTHIITNDGAAIMTVLPLTDTYDPTFLQFSYAVPITPDLVTTISPISGLLVWNDLTDYFGDLAPFQTIVITTVFTATTQIVTTVNQASTEGAQDEYSNDLAAGFDDEPITIIDVPTATPTPTETPTPTPTATASPTPLLQDEEHDDDDDDDDDDESPPATPVAQPTAPVVSTPAATASPVPVAQVVVSTSPVGTGTQRYLPETGQWQTEPSPWPILGLIFGLAGGYFLIRKIKN